MISAGVYTYMVLAWLVLVTQKQNTTYFSFHVNKGVLVD